MRLAAIGFLLTALYGCISEPSVSLQMDQSAVETRSYQSRTFDDVDKVLAMQAVMETLQDLGFVIRSGDARLGLVTASRHEGIAELSVTATVRERTATSVEIRINANLGMQQLDDPEPYRDFFAALTQSLFLSTNPAPAKPAV